MASKRVARSQTLVREMDESSTSVYERLGKKVLRQSVGWNVCSVCRAGWLGHMLGGHKGGQRTTGNNLTGTVRHRPFGGGR